MFKGPSKYHLRGSLMSLTRKVSQMERTQEAALRVVFQLPGVLKNYFAADTLSEGTLSPDGQSMQYEIGTIAGLVVSPWENKITVSDLRGERPPRSIHLNAHGGSYFSQDAVLAMLGYFELLKRTGPEQNPEAWTDQLNGATASAATA